MIAVEARFEAQLVLVDPPRDTKIFEPLGKRRPACPAAIVDVLVQDVSERIRRLLRSDGAGPEVQAVGGRPGQAGAEVLIADGKCVCKCVVKRKVVARVVSQRQRHRGELLFVGVLRNQPAVVAAIVPGIDLVGPGMRQRTHPGRLRVLDIQPEGNEAIAILVRLGPHGVSVGQRDRVRVIESAHAAERAKRMVERPVLLHQDDDVLGVEVGGAGQGLDRRRSPNRLGKQPRGADPGQDRRLLQEISARGWHGDGPLLRKEGTGAQSIEVARSRGVGPR